MRVPIPVVILLCLGVVVGVWWAGTRKHDFLTPPSESQLALFREKGGVATPILADNSPDADSTPDTALVTQHHESLPQVVPPQPADHRDQAVAFAITLHAGTGKSTAAILAPLLEEIARELEQASSGILKITANVTAGQDVPANRGSVPVALWLAGSNTTGVRVFTIGPAESLREVILKNLLFIIRSILSRTAPLTAPEAAITHDNPNESILTGITRTDWTELGSRLNKTLE